MGRKPRRPDEVAWNLLARQPSVAEKKGRVQQCAALRGKNLLDAAGDVGEVQPDFYAAEVGAFGADGSGDSGAEVTGWADVFGELRMNFAKLGDFVERGLVDFF